MSPRPRLSLCIPTWNRGRFLKDALESGLREAASQPPGAVEVIVCDNASSDETQAVIASIHAAHPELRAFRNDENIGFDRNYLRCVEEARGVFVWVMGDDDIWLPGSIARVLRELDAGADVCLCRAEACDVDLRPIIVLNWFREGATNRIWNLEDREGLLRYFDSCAYTAGVFAFISVTIFRKDHFLLDRDSLSRAVGTGYIHLSGMMGVLSRFPQFHLIPEVLVQNRINSDATNGGDDLFGRWMLDFRGFAQIADAMFGDDAELSDSFFRIVGRNHGDDSFLPKFRQSAPTQEAWQAALPFLMRAGFSPTAIAAVDYGFRPGTTDPPPNLVQERDPHSLKMIRFLAREAKRIAIVALGGLQNIIDEAALLRACGNKGGHGQVLVLCTPECLEILEGFEVQCLDLKRYAGDEHYRNSVVKVMLGFGPELIINLDAARGFEGDDLVVAAHAVGAIAYAFPDRVQDLEFIRAANYGYNCLVPRKTGSGALLEALGLEPAPGTLWTSPAAQEEAQTILARLGWDPAKTLVLLVDHPSILEDPTFRSELEEAAEGPWTFLGLGNKEVGYQGVETLLRSMEDRSMNLTGVLGLGETVALLQRCGGFLGGTPLLRSLARACNCTPLFSRNSPPPIG